MKTTTQLRVSLSNDLLKKLETHANNLGLTVGEVVRHMIATNIKLPHQPTAKLEAATPKRAMTAEERLFGTQRPDDHANFQFPDEDEMQRKRQALLASL